MLGSGCAFAILMMYQAASTCLFAVFQGTLCICKYWGLNRRYCNLFCICILYLWRRMFVSSWSVQYKILWNLSEDILWKNTLSGESILSLLKNSLCHWNSCKLTRSWMTTCLERPHFPDIQVGLFRQISLYWRFIIHTLQWRPLLKSWQSGPNQQYHISCWHLCYTGDLLT